MALYSSQKSLEKKRKRRKLKFLIYSILFLVLLIGFVYWARNPKFNIKEISIVNNSFSKKENLKASVSNALKGDMFWLIPKTNSLLIPRGETERKIKQEYPEIEKIDINLKNLDEIEVQIFEYEPKIIWSNGEKKYFVNKEGNIFMEEPKLHSYDNLLVTEDSRKDLKTGENVIDSNFLSDLIAFTNNLSNLDLKINKIKIPDQEVFYLETDKGFKILISKTDNLNSISDNIKTILEDGTLKKDDFGLIDYMDFRFGNKVFYKLK